MFFRGRGDINLGNIIDDRSLIRIRFYPYDTDPNRGGVLHS